MARTAVYDINIRYHTDDGTRILRGSSIRRVRISRPSQIKTLHFFIYAIGVKPQIISRDPQNPGEVYLDGWNEFAGPFAVDSIGTPGYLAIGQYTYSVDPPITEDSHAGFEIPFSPYYVGNVKVQFTKADFIKGYH